MPRTVLIVEDDPTVLAFLEEGLIDRGYGVISARSGGEALSVLDSGLGGIDVLVADIRIGAGLDGWEIARCAREIAPDFPIVYITGDSASAHELEGVANSRLLQKPFGSEQLARAIEALLPTAAE
jgi:DNA-binding response OmpR family regulator